MTVKFFSFACLARRRPDGKQKRAGARAARFPDASGIDTVKEIQSSFVAGYTASVCGLCDMPTFSANATFDMRPSFLQADENFPGFRRQRHFPTGLSS
jgi:hypothetical protein